MDFHVYDRVYYVGEPGSAVTEWLIRERVPGTILKIQMGLVVVAWDGLNVGAFYQEYPRHDNTWSVYSNQLAPLVTESIEDEEPCNCEDIFDFFFQSGLYPAHPN